MAFFTGKDGVVYAQEITNNELAKGAQAELIFIPFPVPWGTTFPGAATQFAEMMDQQKIVPRPWWPGGRGISDMSNYYPYSLAPPIPLMDDSDNESTTDIVDQNMVLEGTNNNEFTAPALGNIGPNAIVDPLRKYLFSKFIDTRGHSDVNFPAPGIKLLTDDKSAPGVGAPSELWGDENAHLYVETQLSPTTAGWTENISIQALYEPTPFGTPYTAQTLQFEEFMKAMWPGYPAVTFGVEDSPLFNALIEKSFRDATFSIKKPFVEVAYGEALGEAIGISDPVKVKAHYNFYLQPYETVVNTTKIETNTTGKILLPETVLPNIYTLISDLAKGSDINAQYQYADQWAPLSIGTAAEAIKKWNSKGNREYFNSMGIHLENSANAENVADTTLGSQIDTKRYYTTGIASNKIKDFMEEADKTKKHFPMYADIEIPPANQGRMGAILYKAGLTDQFMQLIMAAMFPRTMNTKNTKEPSFFRKTFIIKKDSFIVDDPEGGLNMTGWQDSLYEEPLIKLWLNDIFVSPGAAPPPDLDAATTTQINLQHPQYGWWIADNDPAGFMNKLNDQIGNSSFIRPVVIGKKKGSPVKFINNIKWLAAQKKIKDFVAEKTRSVKEIYDGKLAHSEVLFYEIVKFRSDTPEAGGVFVQNIFLPNLPGMEVLKYVDTQVKYGEEYYYQIYAHTFVIGTQYEYMNHSLKGPAFYIEGKGLFEPTSFSYKLAPTVYLMRVPYYNTYVTMGNTTIEDGNPVTDNIWSWDPSKLERTPIHDMPPVFPDITFFPLYAEKNKILINANFNVGEYELSPTMVASDEQKASLDKIRRNQKKLWPKPINFKSDDFCGQIEVLRIDKKPTSYTAFEPVINHRVAILGGSSAFGYIDDTLEPNKDYYYVARAKDVHNNYSNPSPVYRVRIEARDGEAPYAIFEMFFIEEAKEKKPVVRKELMKYIRIQPAFKQSYLNDAALVESVDSADLVTSNDFRQNLGDPNILNEGKTVFGQKFKFRFTSKKTGKKFDLNILVTNPDIVIGENKKTKGITDDYSSGKC